MGIKTFLTVFGAVSIAELGAKTQLAGGLVSQYLSPRLPTYIAGICFIAIGAWVLVSG